MSCCRKTRRNPVSRNVGVGARPRGTLRFLMPVLVCLVAGAAGGAAAQVQLTTNSGGGERHAVINADGTVVAFVAVVGGVREVFTVPVTGGPPVQRTTNADVRVGGTTVFDAWPSLSISDDGNRITYWNAAGVHVIDVAANTDTVVAPANLLPYPQISGDGAMVVYQNPVGGDQEVFVVPATGGRPVQITTSSGPGRRLPHIRGDRVVFQRSVGAFQEVFLHDLTGGMTRGPLSTNSGRGNRYARLTHDGSRIVYEALVAGAIKEVFVLDVASGNVRQVSNNSLRGDRLAAPTEDGEAFYEVSAVNREVQRIDLANGALAAVTGGTSAGYRRISVDRHGTLAVYQAQAGSTTEVFVQPLAYAPRISNYGTAGTPSTGAVQSIDRAWRRSFFLGVDTSLPGGSACVLLVGVQQIAVPVPNAPGNTLYVDPLAALPAALDAAGDVAVSFASPVWLSGSAAYAQWIVHDPAANAFGWVAARGAQIEFR